MGAVRVVGAVRAMGATRVVWAVRAVGGHWRPLNTLETLKKVEECSQERRG